MPTRRMVDHFRELIVETPYTTKTDTLFIFSIGEKADHYFSRVETIPCLKTQPSLKASPVWSNQVHCILFFSTLFYQPIMLYMPYPTLIFYRIITDHIRVSDSILPHRPFIIGHIRMYSTAKTTIFY